MATEHLITRLSTTPVKGLRLHHPDAVELTPSGAAGDRRFYLVDEAGTVQSCTRNQGLYELSASWEESSRRLEVRRGDDVVAAGVIERDRPVATDMSGLRTLEADTVTDPMWGELFSEAVGRRVRLVQARDSAYDVAPVTLLGSASVRELADRAGLDGVDARRFRMLIDFSSEDPHVEDGWDGRRLRVGGAVLSCEGPVKRCAATTRHPDSGESDLQTLRLIKGYRGRQPSILGLGANFGIYARVIEAGPIAVGDRLVVDEVA
ncbi:MOSC domain-containing protein [Nocardioides sambongensis]|uniref:MOSC domain-containing protein n=1 Tax=Nocardioides sambongensis TaxID=2589074 RepID=UPI001126E225|nr:MOSC domain-containing protein [Nocardioides sambongensis]